MLRRNKWRLWATSIVILLPMLFGMIFWNKLPDQIATNWGMNGRANDWHNRSFVVFGIPLFVLAVHLFCAVFTMRDPKNEEQSEKVMGMLLWITPIISLITCGIIYAVAFGQDVTVNLVIWLALGVMFVIIGNYLPKCKRNSTIGIRVKWALESEENWNATHRIGGKIWVIGGLVMIVGTFLPQPFGSWILIGITFLLALIPMAYSYWYSKKV